MGSYLEYKRVPPQLVEPLVLAVLGSLHIRLSSLWGPASEALAAALEHAPDQAWPPVLAALAAAQGGFLTGADRGVPPEGMWVFSASPTSGCRDQQRDWCRVLPHRPAQGRSRETVLPLATTQRRIQEKTPPALLPSLMRYTRGSDSFCQQAACAVRLGMADALSCTQSAEQIESGGSARTA